MIYFIWNFIDFNFILFYNYFLLRVVFSLLVILFRCLLNLLEDKLFFGEIKLIMKNIVIKGIRKIVLIVINRKNVIVVRKLVKFL